MTALKACPFCGDEADIYCSELDNKWRVCCINMGDDDDCILCALDWSIEFETQEEAAAAWNKRTTDE